MKNSMEADKQLAMIGHHIDHEMRFRGVTKQELSRKSGVCRVVLNKILDGETYNISSVLAVAEVLNLGLNLKTLNLKKWE